jgi:hypothetical protein
VLPAAEQDRSSENWVSTKARSFTPHFMVPNVTAAPGLTIRINRTEWRYQLIRYYVNLYSWNIVE